MYGVVECRLIPLVPSPWECGHFCSKVLRDQEADIMKNGPFFIKKQKNSLTFILSLILYLRSGAGENILNSAQTKII